MRHLAPAGTLTAFLLGGLLSSAVGAAERPLDAKLERLEAGRVRLQEFRGSPLLLELWATWCLPCREQAEILGRLEPELSERGISILAVDVGEARDTVAEFLADEPHPFPVVLDRAQVIPRRLAIEELPALVLLNGEGTVAGVSLGLTQADAVLELLSTLD